jgi:hypothetical protein
MSPMRRLFRCLLLVMAAATIAATAARAGDDSGPVDVQLVLAIDSSTSVNMDEYYLQLEGYAAAFRHDDLLKAIRSGEHKAIAVCLFEWSGDKQQNVNFAWRRLSDAEDLRAFATELETAPRLVIGGETAIGAAIDFGADLLDSGDFISARRVIDISGDGANNRGRPVTQARDDALLRGIVINGLAILNEEPALDQYYRANVVGGSGAFVIAARDYHDFADAILRKLLREITTIAAVSPGSRSE